MKLFNKKKKSKHKVVIIYKDRQEFLEVEYPENGRLKHEGNEYYLDPTKHVHVFLAGYVNEVDGYKVHAEAENWGFEPSYTFTNAMDSKIIKDILAGVEEKTTDWFLIIQLALSAATIFLVWSLYQHMDKLMRFLGVG